jgi:2-dehydro-3-deoxy-D-arabinonate dehydratase
VIRLYNTVAGPVFDVNGKLRPVRSTWSELIMSDHLPHTIREVRAMTGPGADPALLKEVNLLPPISNQEVWAAGVTYLRSKVARMEESKEAGAGSFYDKVYDAARPELFFKATPHRVVGPGQKVRIRHDSQWNVPEPELALLVNPERLILGFTIGNDMSSRDIEGENPLYLPQAKVYDGCCALGPCLLLASQPLPKETDIAMEILRSGEIVFSGKTTLAQMKRGLQELVDWLFRDNSFPNGVFLLTGTGVVPPDTFTLQPGDDVRIAIPSIGVLHNSVAGLLAMSDF